MAYQRDKARLTEEALFEAIDCKLARKLDVFPSPEFAAKVRQRLAEEAARPRAFLPRWALAGAVALAACALLVAWFARTPSPVRPSQDPRTWSAAAKLPPSKVEASPPRRASSRTLRGIRASVRLSEPEVLINPAERQCLARLVESLRAGRIDGSPLVTVPPGFEVSEDGSWVPKPLEIDPLKIAALQPESEPAPGAQKTADTQ